MKILVLTSRYTATRDIIGEDFGRQTRLFSALKKRGHDVTFYAADYRKKERKDTTLHGIHVMIRPFGVLRGFSFISELKKNIAKGNYDALIATSDPLWGVVGRHVSKGKMPFIYDLHDNYETYAVYSFPFFGLFEKNAIRKANAITTVGHTLKEFIRPLRKDNVFVVQNGVDTSIFKPMPREKCRTLLKLPKNVPIITYAGTLQRRQGIDILLETFKELREEVPSLRLVLAGRFFGKERKYLNIEQEGVHYLGGNLSQKEVAALINASNVAVVPNKEDPFTLFCFPYKVVEYMACNVPIVATDVGDVGKILSSFKGSLCLPDDRESMKNAIKTQLKKKGIDYRKSVVKNTWDIIAEEFEIALESAIKSNLFNRKNTPSS
jgi:teichuronic acid biosynthesis glycosyltransferase TuaC